MNLNAETIKSMISNRFIIDCIKINLTQEASSDPIIYSGPGSIYQQDDGYFYLKLYHSFNDRAKEHFPNFSKTQIGKYIGDDHYFRMEAIDISGGSWLGSNILLSQEVSYPAVGKIIKTRIRRLEYREEVNRESNDKSKSIFMILPGQYNIPCNMAEDLPNGGWILNTTEYDFSGISIKLVDKKDYLTIQVRDPSGTIDESFRLRFLESLSIIFGKLCLVLCSSFTSEVNRHIELYSISVKIPNQAIESPIHHHSRNDLESFCQFIDRYINCFDKNDDLFYRHWFYIQRSWQGVYENSALTITIAIEGVVNRYFSCYGLPDTDFRQQVDNALKIIKTLNIGDRVKQRIRSNLGSSKLSNPKTALYNLATKGLMNKELVDVWVRLRNQSAHAKIIDEEDKESQKYINEIYSCLNLFYLLLLTKMDFHGTYRDLSKEGWPELHFGFDINSTDSIS